ncbi:uncharacterized protein LOC129316684 [Prosopis cineraria]|uniref:uncharacterized protein LOC129316684 n=1 Tax=Prosopis cineraria TaxID=364024 RepID=UPI00240F3191|nr:uncharacterized protein LOC129316684 [Prosopis cineraria]
MKPTSSSGAKKELSPASLPNGQSDYDDKNQQPKFSDNRKASLVPGKQPAKTLTRPSSLKLLNTLTQNPSFKSSRKSSSIALHADMKAQRTTCLSTLKNSVSPKCLMPNPQVTESERTSVKVCQYTFCSFNGHHCTPLPPLKSFLSERRRIFKALKTMKQEEPRLQRLKVPFKTKVSDIEQIVINDNSACDDAEVGFIEIYANVKDHEAKPTATAHGHETRKLESSEELQAQEVIKFMIKENSLAAREDYIKQVTTNMSDFEE